MKRRYSFNRLINLSWMLQRITIYSMH